MNGRRLARTVIILGALLAAMVPAGAHTSAQNDPNDTSGNGDISRMEYSHANGRTRLSATLYQQVGRSKFLSGFVNFGLNTGPGEDFESTVYMEGRRRNGRTRLYCFIYVGLSRVARVPARLNGRKIECDFPSDLVGGVASQWGGGSYFGGQSDVVPNNGAVKH